MEPVFVYILLAQIFIAPHHPQNKTYPPTQFPDLKVCLEEAELFLNHFAPPPDGHVVAGCFKKTVDERKS